MSALLQLQDAVGRAVVDAGPSVVGLGRGWGVGSGIVTGDGLVLTSAHNLRGEDVTVTFSDGRQAAGRVVGVDVDGDVAVIAVDTGGAPPLPWRTDGDVAVGTPVFALANPGGRGLHVTFGFVSSTGRSFRGPRGRRIADAIEHTAALVRGSSGGPIVDAEGRLLGLNTIRLEGSLILALAADAGFRARVEALARGEAPSRATLGVAIAPPRAARRMRHAVGLPERDGLLVRDVLDGSPAAKAGIERGDLIVAVGGEPVARVDDLFRALDSVETGSSVELALVRGVDERTVRVAFEDGASPLGR